MNSRVPFSVDLSRIKYELELFRLGGPFDLYEEDRQVGVVEPGCYDAHFSYGKLVLSCWGEGWSRSWRVTGFIASTDRLLLKCEKKMGMVACLVELRRGDASQQQSREEFMRKIPSLIESNLPGIKVERAVSARDDRLHLSASHTRLTLSDRGRIIAGIAAGGSEDQSIVDSLLGAAIVWLDAFRRETSNITRLMIFAPRGRATTIAARLTAVRIPGVKISLYEIDEEGHRLSPVTAFDQGDLIDNYRRFAGRAIWPRRAELSSETESLMRSIIHLAPDHIETQERGRHISFSLRGLEFARLSTSRGRSWFGLFEREELEPNKLPKVADLASSIISRRRASPDDINDWMYRALPERWLESVIRRDVSALDPMLDPRWTYSQVPAYRGEKRGYIDVLAATLDGRLVVIELKVSEDPEFPFQGLDYWLRVEWHRLRGDFERRGYFDGLKLKDSPPLLYLVAPIFSFHATTRLIAGAISDQVR
ncbi:MAG TPA: hypothetical protein VFQ92_19540, partial [Blastocatellia bacterium]|nr:hypothetical protein [Blastocatellia bacterium]